MKTTYYQGVLLLLVVGVSLWFSPQPAAASPQAVQPQHGAPGTLFAFYATGFAAEEWVTYWANDPTGRVYEGGTVRVNQFNRADWTWSSPSDAAIGQWSMVAYGVESEVERVIFFDVAEVMTGQTPDMPAGQDSTSYDSAVFPGKGAPGTHFRLFASGFTKYERVIFFATDPNGNTTEIGAFGTNEFGRVDWTWKSPAEMAYGQWTIVARGDKSHVERVMKLTIHAPEDYPELAEPVDSYDCAVTPGRGTPGETFYFYARNFDEGERVDYEIIAPDGTVHAQGRSHADFRTRVDWFWRSPANAMPGIWTSRAVGRMSTVERIVTFELYRMETGPLIPSQQIPYDSAVHPAQASAGSEFAFFATGYIHEEYVTYQCIDPDGVVQVSGKVKSNEFGRADWTCNTPYNAKTGYWTSIATGKRSDVERVLHFLVTR